MLDDVTIRNTVKKRLDPYLGHGMAGFSRLIPVSDTDDVLVSHFRDAVGVGIAVAFGGHVFGFTYRLPKEPEHRDALNAVDYFVEAIKHTRRNLAAAKQWKGAYAQ
jgi:hypothetical protein